MEVSIHIDKNNAVQFAEYLNGNITKDYEVYLVVKEVLYQLQHSEEFSLEQKENLRRASSKFEEDQQKYFMWGSR